MFEKLKEKLGGFKKALGTVLETKEKEAIKTEPAKVESVKVETVKAGIKTDVKADVKTDLNTRSQVRRPGRSERSGKLQKLQSRQKLLKNSAYSIRSKQRSLNRNS